jgi:hypothetical protein
MDLKKINNNQYSYENIKSDDSIVDQINENIRELKEDLILQRNCQLDGGNYRGDGACI